MDPHPEQASEPHILRTAAQGIEILQMSKCFSLCFTFCLVLYCLKSSVKSEHTLFLPSLSDCFLQSSLSWGSDISKQQTLVTGDEPMLLVFGWDSSLLLDCLSPPTSR